MERASTVRIMSQIKTLISKFKQQPRRGQLRVLEELERAAKRLNIKLPTGYGKTYTAMAVYSILKSLGEVNRLLIIFPSVPQLVQFEQAAAKLMNKCCVDGPADVCDVSFFGAQAIAKHQSNKCQIYAITVQSLIGSRGMDNISTLLSKGRWMIVVDEYHHYGIDLPFGNAVNALNAEFLLCMSATPYRPNQDSAFGEPSVVVCYRDAVEEKAVKPLVGHSYNYKVDAITEDNEVISFTTEEVISEAGGDSPNAIEKMIYNRKLRWSPKYISPLVCNPLSRMIAKKIESGLKLQAIVGAMCVSHAEMVCDQIKSAFPDLVCEWVGTGDDGKSPEANAAILKKFAPVDGSDPVVDVLVHVGMAGEGLDTVLVTEVIHLNAASVNNTNNQENGRAARYVEDGLGCSVIGNINFDAGSGYAIQGYVGSAIMDAMDNMPPRCDEDEIGCNPGRDANGTVDLPNEPWIRILNAECISIDSGDIEVQNMAKILADATPRFNSSDLDDPSSDLWDYAIAGVKRLRSAEAIVFNEKAVVKQWQEAVNGAATTVTGNACKMLQKSGLRFDKALLGDLKKRINTKKKRDLGPLELSVDSLKKHYNWLTMLNKEVVNEGVPQWLR